MIAGARVRCNRSGRRAWSFSDGFGNMYAVPPNVGLRSGLVLLVFGLGGFALAGCGGEDPPASAAVDAQQRIERDTTRLRERNAEQEAEVRRLREEVERAKAVSAQGARGGEAEASSPPSESPSERDRQGSAAGPLSSSDRASFAKLEQKLGGRSGIAVSSVGRGQPISVAGSFQEAVAWSTSKVPVAMAAIAVGSADDDALRSAITASDNASAERLWTGLGGGTAAANAADEQLRATGDSTTSIQPTVLRSGFTAFGQTMWSLRDQVAFTAGMACTDTGRQLLELMGQTIPAQRWGLGRTSWTAQLKGGWGPGAVAGQGGGYIDRQMGVLTDPGGRKVAVTVMTEPSGGSHEAGISNLNEIASWLVKRLDPESLTSSPSC